MNPQALTVFSTFFFLVISKDSIASNGSSSGVTALNPASIAHPPPPPYQLTPSLSSAIYSELGHHYQSMFPSAAATKTWLKEHEQYGKLLSYLFFSSLLRLLYTIYPSTKV